MGELIFIGLGLYGDRGLSLSALECIEASDKIYLEAYTSPIPEDLESSLTNLTGKKVERVSRVFIEDGRRIIDEAKERRVVLIASGDPMIATTHMDLRVRAEQVGVKTKIIHNASILTAIPGETGLHAYKFGKTVTLTQDIPASVATVYNTVYENLVHHLHTTILLEYDYESKYSLTPTEALKSLLDEEKDFKQNVFDKETFVIVASKLGSRNQTIQGGRIVHIVNRDFGEPPHIIIVTGGLHFSEVDALKTLLKIGEDEIFNNSSRVQRLAVAMVTRYVKKTKEALRKAQERCRVEGRAKFSSLFENVDCYLSDAERFLNEGKYELAVLSIGYAEGLLDSLRLIEELEVEW